MAYRRLFTSESVTEGHPDKLADQISDAVLDAILANDPQGRVACETFAITGQIHIAGEISTTTYVDIPRIVRDTISEIGYDRSAVGFDCETCGVSVSVDEQSPDIAMGVDKSLEVKETGERDPFELTGAGDQGMMFGYACRETQQLMPLPITLAHDLTRLLAAKRKNGDITYLRPDGKSQVTVEYDGHKPVRVDAVVISTQHDPDVPLDLIRREVTEHIIDAVIPRGLRDEHLQIFVNPTGRFVIGGPEGRRRPDRAQDHRRHVRRHGAARRRRVLGQGPHQGRPLGGVRGALRRQERRRGRARGALRTAGRVRDRRRAPGQRAGRDVRHRRDRRREDRRAGHGALRPAPGRDHPHLDLRRPIYKQTASYGHFGRPELDLPWEKIDKAAALRADSGCAARSTASSRR